MKALEEAFMKGVQRGIREGQCSRLHTDQEIYGIGFAAAIEAAAAVLDAYARDWGPEYHGDLATLADRIRALAADMPFGPPQDMPDARQALAELVRVLEQDGGFTAERYEQFRRDQGDADEAQPWAALHQAKRALAADASDQDKPR